MAPPGVHGVHGVRGGASGPPPASRPVWARGRSNVLEFVMRPAMLAGPIYLADPPPACLTDAMVGLPRGRGEKRSYWSHVLRDLPPGEEDQVDEWLTRVRRASGPPGPGSQASTRPRSRSRGPEPGPAGGAERGAPSDARPSRVGRPSRVSRPSRASHLESMESLEPVRAPVPPGPLPRRPVGGHLESTESLEPAGAEGAPILLLISRPRDAPEMDVERAWSVDCQFLWTDVDEEMEEHLGLHPSALEMVAPRLGSLLPVVLDALESLESAAPLGCLQLVCDDGRTASVAATCLVDHLLTTLGRPHHVQHLGLEYDSHQQTCLTCCGLVPEDAAETVLELWRALPLE